MYPCSGVHHKVSEKHGYISVSDNARLYGAFRQIPWKRFYSAYYRQDPFADFKKCQYIDLGKTSFENVVMKASESMSSLIIVNTRAEAQQLYKMLSGVKYHLSTYMIPEHRSAVIKRYVSTLKILRIT